jgi:hypothetical protein
VIQIKLCEVTGPFAEGKDAAARLRRELILPALERNESVEIDL